MRARVHTSAHINSRTRSQAAAHLKEEYFVIRRLLVFLTSDEGFPSTEEVLAFMPAPQTLVEMDRAPWLHLWHTQSLVMLGARAYLRLGKHEEAEATAQGGLAEAKKVTTRVECHRILGVVAALRGDLKQAEASFVAGMEEARDTGLHLLELLCARDVKQFVVEKSQRQVDEVDALITAAAARMNKTTADFGMLLAKRRKW